MPERDRAKEVYWRRELADWEKSGLGIAEYCRKRGIPDYQFKNWQRRMRVIDAERAPAPMPASSRKRATASAKALANKFKSATESGAEFAEVMIVDSPAPLPHARQAPARTGGLEIVLPTGITLRLGPDCSTELLSSVLFLLEERSV